MRHKFITEAQYYIVKGWFEETGGIHEGVFHGAYSLPGKPLTYLRAAVKGNDARLASARAFNNVEKIYSNEIIEEGSEDPELVNKKFQGLDIVVENPKGSTRSGRKGNKEWEIKMKCDYGFLKKVNGADGEGVDVYLGDDNNPENAYIVHQNDTTTGNYDEDKVMLGFKTAEEAKESYLAHYDDPKFFGSLTVIPMETFKAAVNSKSDAFKWKSKKPQTGVKLEMVCSGGIAERPAPLGGTLGIKDQEVLLTKDDKPRKRKKVRVPKLPHSNKIGPRIPTISQTGGKLGGKSQ